MTEIDAASAFRDAKFFEQFAVGTIFHLKFARAVTDGDNPFQNQMLAAYSGLDGRKIVMDAGFGKFCRIDPVTIVGCTEVPVGRLSRVSHDLHRILSLSVEEQEDEAVSALRIVNRLRGLIQCNPTLFFSKSEIGS